WDRVIIQDVPIDFIAIWLFYPVGLIRGQPTVIQTLEDLKKIHYAIEFDEIYQTLKGEGNSVPEVIALLTSAKRFLNGEITFIQAQELLNLLFDQLNPESR